MGQLSLRLLALLYKLKRFQLKQNVPLVDEHSFIDQDFANAAADSRPHADFIAFDKARDVRLAPSMLTVDQQQEQHRSANQNWKQSFPHGESFPRHREQLTEPR